MRRRRWRRMCGWSRRRMRRRRLPRRRRWLRRRGWMRRRRRTRRYRRSWGRMVWRMWRTRRFISVPWAEATVGFLCHQVGENARADDVDWNRILMPEAGVRGRRRRYRARRRRQITVAHSARRRGWRRRGVVRWRGRRWRDPRADDRDVPAGVGNVKDRARAAMRVRENPAVLIGRDDGVVNSVKPVRTLAGGCIEVSGDHAILEQPLVVQQGVRQSIGLACGEIERLRGSQQLFGVGAQLCARGDVPHDRRYTEPADDVRCRRIGLRANGKLRREKRRGNKAAEQALCRDSQRTSLLQTRACCVHGV
jgi:hypothetical protein